MITIEKREGKLVVNYAINVWKPILPSAPLVHRTTKFVNGKISINKRN